KWAATAARALRAWNVSQDSDSASRHSPAAASAAAMRQKSVAHLPSRELELLPWKGFGACSYAQGGLPHRLAQQSVDRRGGANALPSARAVGLVANYAIT